MTRGTSGKEQSHIPNEFMWQATFRRSGASNPALPRGVEAEIISPN